MARSRRARRRAGDELWVLRAPIRRAIRTGREAGAAKQHSAVLAVLAIGSLALVGTVTLVLLPPAKSGSGPEAEGRAAARDAANLLRAAVADHPQAPEPRRDQRRRPSPAPVRAAAPAVPAPAPPPPAPAAPAPPAVEEPPPPGDTAVTPTGPVSEPGDAPDAPDRASPEDDRLLDAPAADPAPAPEQQPAPPASEQPPAPPAGEPLPSQPGEGAVPRAPAQAPEPPAAP